MNHFRLCYLAGGLNGWRAESTLGGFIMNSPRVAAERRRTENGD